MFESKHKILLQGNPKISANMFTINQNSSVSALADYLPVVQLIIL